MSQEGLDLKLPPEAARKGPTPAPASVVVVEYSAARELSINHRPVTLDGIQERLQEIFASRRDKTLYIDAAPSLRYGEVIPLVDAAKGAGVERVGVITPGMKAGR